MRFPLYLRLRPSPTLLFIASAGHLLGFAAGLFGLESVWLRGACGLIIALSLTKSIADERDKTGLILELGENGELALGDESGISPGVPVIRTTDFRWVVWVTWRSPSGKGRPGRIHSLMLLSDHLAGEEWRMLRIWLRHNAALVSCAGDDAP